MDKKEKREIKFRAWDKKLSKMWNLEELLKPVNYEQTCTLNHLLDEEEGFWDFYDDSDEYGELHTDYLKDDFILMQYTGLKDRDGKEIYEGDILQSGVLGYEGDYSCGIITVEDVVKYGHIRLGIEVAEYKMAVLGNIYENPNLISK